MRFGWVAAAAALLTMVFAGQASAASSIPEDDSFYRLPNEKVLEKAKPGDILRKRDVTVSLAGSPADTPSTQVLYRTTNQLGEPTATVATIIRPAAPAGSTRLLSYQTAYDGVASTCRPSYALRTGNTGANAIVQAEGSIISAYLLLGYTIVTSDYQGPSDDFGAGMEEGRGTLDAIRATETALGASPGTVPTVLTGYSGGSIASMWAAQEAPEYAPELKLLGVAAGGIPTDFAHNLDYIAGSPDWAGAIPAVGIGLARGSRIDLGKMLSERGREIAATVQQGCLDPGGFPGLKLEDMLKPEYQDWRKVPALVKIFNESIMGRTGTPNIPMLMAVGNDDGTGDSVMIAKDVQELARTYCDRGLSVQYSELMGQDHTAAFVGFAPQAFSFVGQRFAGSAPGSDCPIAPGNPLTPLEEPGGKIGPTDGILVESIKVRKGKASVLVRATASDLNEVAVGLERKRKGGYEKFGSPTELTDQIVGYDGVRVNLRRKLKKGVKYRVVATGRLQTDPVETAAKVKKKRRKR